MTEIPEHLLKRSRERRAALSGEEEATATVEPAATGSAAPVLAGGTAPATEAGGGGATATITEERPPIAEPEPEPQLGPTHPRIPVWAMAALAMLPLWAVVYLGAFGNRTKANANDPVTLGAQVFASNCASCHGTNGEGGVGPQLNGGEVLKVWPTVDAHRAWVKSGGAPFVGKTIGVNLKIAVPANNVMPAFGSSLSDTQVNDVVCYERVSFGGETESAGNCPGFTG